MRCGDGCCGIDWCWMVACGCELNGRNIGFAIAVGWCMCVGGGRADFEDYEKSGRAMMISGDDEKM